MITIKVTGIAMPLFRQIPGGKDIWGDVRFVNNNPDVKECDYWFIFDSYGLEVDHEAFCPPHNVYFVMGETEEIRIYNKRFVKQFRNLITVQKMNYGVKNVFHDYFPVWFAGLIFNGDSVELNPLCDYDHLSQSKFFPRKTKKMSIIASNKTMCEGHLLRYNFAKKVKDYFGDDVDFFGRGIRGFADKWDVLAPYKYHIAIENYATKDYITEKFHDPLLAWCYPIYYGAPNVSDYFNPSSFTTIDIKSPDNAIRIIEDILTRDPYENKLEAINESREKVLNEENVFQKMSAYAKKNLSDEAPKKIIIHHELYYSWRARLKKHFPFLKAIKERMT